MWYKYLVKDNSVKGYSVEHDHKLNTDRGRIFVRLIRQLKDYNSNSFNTWADFLDMITNFNIDCPPSMHWLIVKGDNRTLTEKWGYVYHYTLDECIVPGPRKMFFDLDMENVPPYEGRLVLLTIIRLLVSYFKEVYSIDLNLDSDIVICESCRPEKQSYHLIVHNYAVHNHEEAKLIAVKIKSQVHDNYKKYIDLGLYSNIHNLRMLGYCKPGTAYVKNIMDKWEDWEGKSHVLSYNEEPKNDYHKLILQYRAALVSTTLGCNILAHKIVPEKYKLKYNFDDIPEEDLDAIMDLVPENDAFKLKSIKNNMIALTRIRPSLCPACNDIHEHQNPYLFIIRNRVYWCCRRLEDEQGKKVKILLGCLAKEDISITSTQGYCSNNNNEKQELLDQPLFPIDNIDIANIPYTAELINKDVPFSAEAPKISLDNKSIAVIPKPTVTKQKILPFMVPRKRGEPYQEVDNMDLTKMAAFESLKPLNPK